MWIGANTSVNLEGGSPKSAPVSLSVNFSSMSREERVVRGNRVREREREREREIHSNPSSWRRRYAAC